MADEIPVRLWRIQSALPRGCTIWFDPETEHPRLFEGPPSDSESLDGSVVQTTHRGSEELPEGGGVVGDKVDLFRSDLIHVSQVLRQLDLPLMKEVDDAT